MSKIHDDDWGAEGITAEDDFIEKFEKAFPEFVLPPSEIVKIYQKNERYKVNMNSLTPEQDKRLEDCIGRLEEINEQD